jgi:DNA-directed RNA polymerase subunit RPC12/RpoP
MTLVEYEKPDTLICPKCGYTDGKWLIRCAAGQDGEKRQERLDCRCPRCSYHVQMKTRDSEFRDEPTLLEDHVELAVVHSNLFQACCACREAISQIGGLVGIPEYEEWLVAVAECEEAEAEAES